MAAVGAWQRAVSRHQQRWGRPQLVSRAPGRVNLIGEHTDYNEGFTLPMGLPFDTVVALSPGGGVDADQILIDADGFGEASFGLGDPPEAVPSWATHLYGCAVLLQQVGVDAGGWKATIDTDVPTGASLSSSAALEVAVIGALLARANQTWAPIDIARLGQRVENEVVGLQSGIMDQFISAGAVARSASLMDCRALTLSPVPLPESLVVAIMDTGTRRVLAEAAYDDRRRSCERAAALLGVSALRDATIDMVATLADDELRRRARHVVTANQRALDSADILRSGVDVGPRFGALMNESHRSLRDDYEVSGPGLDAIVDVATRAPGCYGARMTGGGFAGCAVALVDAERLDEFTAHLVEGYDHDGHTATVWSATPSAGAEVLPPD